MTRSILVAYASGSGSTAEVAEVIAQVIAAGGASVDVRHVNNVAGIESYDGVVVGSSIRIGRWLPDALDFVEDYHQAFAKKPIAYFTTCLTMVADDEEARRTVLAYLEPVLQIAPEINLIGMGLFAGSLAPERAMTMPSGFGPYGDFRDWDAIRGWAESIRRDLMTSSPSEAAVVQVHESVLRFSDLPKVEGHVEMSGGDLRRAELSESDLRGAELIAADLTMADLRRAVLDRANLNWARINGGNLSQAQLQRANLMGAQLRNADLSGAVLAESILNGSDLRHANMQAADLTAADLHWADLSHANLRGADLRRARLSWTNLSFADLEGAQLQGALYNSLTQWPSDFSAEAAGCILVKRLH